MSNLEQRVAAIEARNRAVSNDKAWEMSWLRRLLIAGLTYVVVVAYHLAIGADRPLVFSIVPTIGFILSTLTVGWAKQRWLSRR